MASFNLLISGYSDVSVGEEFAKCGGSPRVEIEEFRVSPGAVNIELFGCAPEVVELGALRSASQLVDVVDALMGAR